MAGSGKKWLIGCGIGCGLMLVILIGMGSCAYYGVKRIGNRVDELEISASVLSDLYGQVDDFSPPSDGIITSDRLEAFLAVRQAILGGGNDLSRYLAILDDRPDEQGKESGKLQKIQAGLKLLPAIFDFADERNRALLDAGMSPGEYIYIYSLCYFAWLDKALTDGPSFSVTDNDDEDDDNVQWTFGSNSNDEAEIRENRERDMRIHLNRVGRAMLTNQLHNLDDSRDLTPGLKPEVWRAQLAAEVELLASERLRLPWEEGLPGHIAAALEMYRFDLEASYDDLLSPIDIGLIEQD